MNDGSFVTLIRDVEGMNERGDTFFEEDRRVIRAKPSAPKETQLRMHSYVSRGPVCSVPTG